MRVSFSQSQKNDPEVRAGVRIPYSPGKRSVSKLLWWSILAFVFAPLLILLWNLIFGWENLMLMELFHRWWNE